MLQSHLDIAPIDSRPSVGEVAGSAGSLYGLRLRKIYSYLRKEEWLFLLICLYLFLEYVRPQTIYPAINVLPFSFVVIMTTLALLVMRGGKYVSNPENKLILAFLAVILLSSAFALSPGVAFQYLPEFGAWVIIYFLIINIVNSESRFLIFMLSFLLYNFKMSQFAFRGWAGIGFGYSDWGTGGGPGWFQNSGEFGIAMCVFLPLSVYFILALRSHWPRWKLLFFTLFPITALTGMISSSSRGALVGGAAVLVWMGFSSGRKVKTILALGVIASVLFLMIPPEQMARLEASGEDRTSINRLERWDKGLEMAARYPVFGVGYYNWAVADARFYGEAGSLSHNIYIQCLSELGYVGLAVFLLMILYSFINNALTRRLAAKEENRFIYLMAYGLDAGLVGFLVSGFFVTVLYYPYFWINLAMTVALNHIARSRHEKLSVGRTST
jgi:putative inorganic carbon (hco3(-)) transporter